VVGADDDGALWEDPGEPSGRPGFRAPHVPVLVDGDEQSTLDLFGRDFVVLAGQDGASWCAAAPAAGTSLGVLVDAYQVGGEVSDPAGGLEAALGIGAEGAVLVRPDGFVAWRASADPEDPEAELTAALGAALGRHAAIAAGG
jgi:aklavinone 12-hydroxylase